MAEKIMIVDGNSIVNRAFYGVPLLTNSEGKYTNGVYGFLNILFKLLDEDKPEYLAVAFDLKGPTFRHDTFKEYKGTRKGMPEELREQMPLLKEMLTKMNIRIVEMAGFEADDILGTISAQAEAAGIEPIVVSGDRDLLQLASETLRVRIPKTKGGRTEVEDYYAADVIAKYGVTPTEFIDVKALMGDASDNIPGVPKIGEKTATKIIQQYQTIENAIAHADEVKPNMASKNLQEFQEQARLSKFLATIIRDMPLEFVPETMKIDGMFNAESYAMVKRLNFKSMFTRFGANVKLEEVEVEQISLGGVSETSGWVLAEDDDIPDAFLEVEEPKTTPQMAGTYIQMALETKDVFANLPKEETACIFVVDGGVFCGLALYQGGAGGTWIEASAMNTAEDILEMAKDFLMDQDSSKVGHDIKKDFKLLRELGVNVTFDAFDTAIGAYILNPTNSSYAYDDLARDFLGEVIPSEEEILGKGRKKVTLHSLTVEERMQFVLTNARVLLESKQVILQKLKANQQEELFYDMEMPLVYVLNDMETYGIKIDKNALMVYQDMLEGKINTLTTQIYDLAGEEFNINSPKQMGVVLFENLGLKGGKKTKTGYSTAADVLEKLRLEHPIVAKILEYRQLAKLKSTYADGLLTVMDETTEKIYSTFNQTITATGRISSTEPNLQNIPVRMELGRELRKIFIPQSDEYCFLDADYSQIELRVLAHIAGDETLIYAFNHNQDIHRLTASQVFHVPFEEVTDLQRRNAKAVNFGIVYGIGAFSLSQDLEITRKEAEAYIAAYFAKYPKIKEYLDQTVQDAKENGYAKTLWNRRRDMPELQSSNFIQRSFGERVAMNMPIQGSAADIIKIAMVKVREALIAGGYRSRLILQVHDELLIETHKDEVVAVSKILKENMEMAASLSVPLDVDVHKGNSWYEAK
ncbi:DNA polymerase I [Chakrabartyella piscis]|uniref:DNA polymerase I n=1 Tax=Chakrabartyella piscis TaxID=2918914 RepID=UPI0029583608|nr:DNA polymerase I [Chakrabartyella piscis]